MGSFRRRSLCGSIWQSIYDSTGGLWKPPLSC